MWFIFALITSLLYALYYIANQQSKLNPKVFIVYRGLLVALIATPFALIYHHIFPWQFYAIVLFQGLIISYMDYKYFQAFQKFGAENVNSIKPLTILITFILWLIIRPNTLFRYFETPLRSFVIVISLLLIIYATINYRHQKIGNKTLQFLAPLLFLSSAIDMSNKIITEYSDGLLLPLTFHRVALTGWIIGIINLCLNYRQITCKELVSFKNIRQGYFLILLILSMITINLSMYYTPHPAYTSAIIYLSVIWIVAFNKVQSLMGKKSNYPTIERKWIFLLLFASIILILAVG